MIANIHSQNLDKNSHILDSMFRDRKRVFVDILRWDVPTSGPYEKDQFDDDEAEYFIICDHVSGQHFGSMRILRTDRPHILGSIFPQLCETDLPTGPEYRELTRLCLSPSLRARDRLHVRNRLFTSLVEYALLNGIEGYTGVAEIGWYSQLLALGWKCTPLGLPQDVNGEMLAAVLAHISPDTINLFRATGTYESGEFILTEQVRKAA